MTDRVELLVIARRAEAEWMGVSNAEYTEGNPYATDRLDAVLNDVFARVADHIRHYADVKADDDYWSGMYRAADLVEEL